MRLNVPRRLRELDMECYDARDGDPLLALDLACDIVWRLITTRDRVAVKAWARKHLAAA